MTILITGGAGYIGSHACLQLLAAGFDPVVIDNFCNSKPEALRRVREIAGRDFHFQSGDLADTDALVRIMRERNVTAVLHFAGLKAVAESVVRPLDYYRNNVGGTLALCAAMRVCGVRTLVFSSSATVYGVPDSVPLAENAPLRPNQPYGRSKLMIEEILRDLQLSEPDWRIALLRYFNPVGAHPSGRIGEDPQGLPGNLFPCLARAAAGTLPEIRVFGADYPTADGSGVRDYIHVEDLVRGHLLALDKLRRGPGLFTFNLGSGRGYSVFEVIRKFSEVCGRRIPWRLAPRRAGDVAECYADPARAEKELGWCAEKGLAEMCADSWRWQNANPRGYV